MEFLRRHKHRRVIGKKHGVVGLLLGIGLAGRNGIAAAIKCQCGQAGSGASTAHGDKQIAMSVAAVLAQVNRAAHHFHRTDAGKAFFLAVHDEKRAPAGTAVAALAIHQRKHVLLAIGIQVGAGDVVVVRFDFGIDLLKRCLGERKHRRGGLREIRDNGE